MFKEFFFPVNDIFIPENKDIKQSFELFLIVLLKFENIGMRLGQVVR